MRRQVHQLIGSDSVATVYFVDAPGRHEPDYISWRDTLLRSNFTDTRPWFPAGPITLREAEVRRVAKLSCSNVKKFST